MFGGAIAEVLEPVRCQRSIADRPSSVRDLRVRPLVCLLAPLRRWCVCPTPLVWIESRRSVVRMTYNRQLNGVVLVVNSVAIISATFGTR